MLCSVSPVSKKACPKASKNSVLHLSRHQALFLPSPLLQVESCCSMSADRRPHRCWSPRSPRPWPAAPPCKREALPAVHPARPAPERPLNTSRIIHCLQPHPCSCWAPETSLWSEKTLQSSVSVVWVTNTYTEQLCSICNSEANPKAHPGEIRGVRVALL